MSRTLATAMEEAITADLVRPVFLVDLMFSSAIYLSTIIGETVYNNGSGDNSYYGVGELLKMSPVDEVQDLGAAGITLNLSGINGTELLNKALTEDYQGKTVTIRLGALDAQGALVNNPIVIFAGFMDVMSLSEGGGTAVIQLTVENKLIRLDKTNVRRYTSQDQRAVHSTDKGFDYVTNIANKDITWGAQTEKAAKQQLQ
tara:strand:- start:6007 stop:6609 length:603 start_codon:yes stop_codon:yes gene_type:complete